MNVLETTIAYLASKLDVPVSADVPMTRPPSFVAVDMPGSSLTLVDESASLTIQAWGDRLGVEDLAESVCDAMLAMPSEVDSIMSVEVQKSYYPALTGEKSPRYVISCDVYRAG